MLVIHGHEEARVRLAPAGAVALGNFDGVHLGHQALCRHAQSCASHSGGPAAVFTFEPHPTRVLAPAQAPPLIMPLLHRVDVLAALGLDAVILEPFTLELSKLAPEAFVRQVLVEALRVRDVVVGESFTFGHRRAGTTELLGLLGSELGFATHVVKHVEVEGQACSSTRVRQLLLAGDVESAATLLGRPFGLRGTVVQGRRRGRTLGFPTANVEAAVELLPRSGVYSGHLTRLQRAGTHPLPAVINVGVAPTFGEGLFTVEAHALDFTGDLYGERVEVGFQRRLRDERRFAGPEELVRQIAKDVGDARRALFQPP